MPNKQLRGQIPSPIHWIYHVVLTIIEPILATGGILQLYLDPTSYLKLTNPHSWHHFRAEQSSLLTQISGGWFIIVFNDLFILRGFPDDPVLWRRILAAHLGSDLLYSYAIIQDIGWLQFLNPMQWSAVEWLTAGTTLVPLLLKIAFLLGLGVRRVSTATVTAGHAMRKES